MGLDSGDATETGAFSVRGEGTEAEPPKVVNGPQLRDSPLRAYDRQSRIRRISTFGRAYSILVAPLQPKLTLFSVLVSTCSTTLDGSGLGVVRSLLIFPPNMLNGLNPVFGSACTGVTYPSETARSRTALRCRDGLLVGGRGRTERTGILREVAGSEETPARNCSESDGVARGVSRGFRLGDTH